MTAIEKFNQAQLKPDVADFRIGDTVAVSVRIKEGAKERIQVFEGTVIARKGGRPVRDVYSPQNQPQHRRGEGVPRSFAECRGRKSDPPRQSPQGEALLPQRPGRQGRESQREDIGEKGDEGLPFLYTNRRREGYLWTADA